MQFDRVGNCYWLPAYFLYMGCELPFFARINACRCIGRCTALRWPMQRSEFANAMQCLVDDESRAVNELLIECGYTKNSQPHWMGLRGICVSTFPFGKMLD